MNSTVNSQLECQNVILPAEWCGTGSTHFVHAIFSPAHHADTNGCEHTVVREGDKRQGGRAFVLLFSHSEKEIGSESCKGVATI